MGLILFCCIFLVLFSQIRSNCLPISPAANNDYFPVKYTTHATSNPTWTVEYHNTYKFLNISGNSYVLYACGTTPPNRTDYPTSTFVSIPPTRVAVIPTTLLSYFELLGLSPYMIAISGVSYISSQCLRQDVSSSRIQDVYNTATYSTNVTKLALTQPDIVFANSNFANVNFPTIVTKETAEKTLLGVAEYLVVISLFFNKEGYATQVMNDIAQRFSCSVQLASSLQSASDAASFSGSSTVNVFWGYWYGGYWYVASCPNYYCEALTDLGVNLLIPPYAGTGLYGGYTDISIASTLLQADVIIYASTNWDSGILPLISNSSAPTYSSTASIAVTSSKAYINKRIFDIGDSNKWFEERPSQPDAFLQDLLAAIRPGSPAAIGHSRVWLRNVFTEPLAAFFAATNVLLNCTAVFGVEKPLSSSTCAAIGAPGYVSTGSSPNNSVALAAGLGAGLGGLALILLVVGVVMFTRHRNAKDSLLQKSTGRKEMAPIVKQVELENPLENLVKESPTTSTSSA
jgi:ABC-type Fe3+-hydroxamate transport system substrate-binding protein